MPLTRAQREALYDEAKSWLGTPYRGHSCVKKHGADCGQLIYGIFRGRGFHELELPTDYSLQVAQHRTSTEYIEVIDRFFRPITEAQAQLGDLVVYEIGKAYSHAALIVEWPGYVIQAEVRHGVSGAHGIKTPAFRRANRVFRTLRDEYCAEVR